MDLSSSCLCVFVVLILKHLTSVDFPSQHVMIVLGEAVCLVAKAYCNSRKANAMCRVAQK
jgi:hypothetical protein